MSKAELLLPMLDLDDLDLDLEGDLVGASEWSESFSNSTSSVVLTRFLGAMMWWGRGNESSGRKASKGRVLRLTRPTSQVKLKSSDWGKQNF